MSFLTKNQTSWPYAVGGLVLVILFIVTVAGWVINFFEIIGSFADPIGAEFVMRVIGIFVFPLGSFMGWFV